jgi:hypothetical protein
MKSSNWQAYISGLVAGVVHCQWTVLAKRLMKESDVDRFAIDRRGIHSTNRINKREQSNSSGPT